MNDRNHTALLPAGLRDVLPPDAEHEARVVARVLDYVASRGYERVQPPLVEFEDGLLAGAGAAMAAQIFRLMDPVSQRMMGVRADTTPQIARIAVTRLARAPRPLRLSYAGQVLRVQGSQLRPERQFNQVGLELIGSAAPEADAEVIVLAAESLGMAGVDTATVDLNLPTLVPAVCEGLGIDSETERDIRAALDRKDTAAVAALGGPAAEILGAMLDAAGPQKEARRSLGRIDLPPRAADLRDHLSAIVDLVTQLKSELDLTIDPVEHRGFEYQTGVSFTLFALGTRGPLGRGGRYRVGDSPGEAATGFTLFMDTVLRALPPPPRARRVFVPTDVPGAAVARLQGDGWVTVASLEPVADPAAEARRLICTHVLRGERVVALEPMDEN